MVHGATYQPIETRIQFDYAEHDRSLKFYSSVKKLTEIVEKVEEQFEAKNDERHKQFWRCHSDLQEAFKTNQRTLFELFDKSSVDQDRTFQTNEQLRNDRFNRSQKSRQQIFNEQNNEYETKLEEVVSKIETFYSISRERRIQFAKDWLESLSSDFNNFLSLFNDSTSTSLASSYSPKTNWTIVSIPCNNCHKTSSPRPS